MQTKFLKSNEIRYVKFLDKPIEIQYHTLNFLRAFNLPIHVACKTNCLICQINKKIELKKELILSRFEAKYERRPYVDKKIEFVILVSELIQNKDFDYYYLKLKPKQMLSIVDFFLTNNIENVCDIDDTRLFEIKVGQYSNITEIKTMKMYQFLPTNMKKYLDVIDKVNKLNVYEELGMISNYDDIKTVAYIYSNEIKKVLI